MIGVETREPIQSRSSGDRDWDCSKSRDNSHVMLHEHAVRPMKHENYFSDAPAPPAFITRLSRLCEKRRHSRERHLMLSG